MTPERGARTATLAAIVGDTGLVRETASLDEMAVVGRELRDRGIDVLAVCGGDGSFFRTLSAVVRVYLSRLRRGLPLGLPEMYDNLAQRVRVEFSDPTHYMIDGDIVGVASQLTMETGFRLRIIRR